MLRMNLQGGPYGIIPAIAPRPVNANADLNPYLSPFHSQNSVVGFQAPNNRPQNVGGSLQPNPPPYGPMLG